MVEPVDPFQGFHLDLVDGAPGWSPANDLGLVKAVDCLSQGIVVGVTDASNRGFDARFGKAFGISD